MPRLRIGYVGCGHLAQLVHIPNLMAATDRCELSAIAEVRPRLARQVAEHWRIPRVHASHRELAADREIDAVVVSGHWATQGDIAMDLLAAGKDVLMEKPMAASVEQGERIVATARASGRRLMVAYMKRYDAGNVLLKATLHRCRADGSLGRLRYVRNQAILGDWTAGLTGAYFGTDEPHPPGTDHWPSWLPEAHRPGYFGYIQQYTHNINFLRWLLDASPGTVTPRAVILDPHDGLSGVTVLDVGGTLVCVESGGMRCHEWNERTSFFFDHGAIESSMFTLLLRNVPSTVEIYAKSEGATRTELFPADGRTWAYRNEVDHFLDCLASGAPFRSSAEDALEDVRVLEQIYRRHATAGVMRGAA
jgi:predicted dehydrogenase